MTEDYEKRLHRFVTKWGGTYRNTTMWEKETEKFLQELEQEGLELVDFIKQLRERGDEFKEWKQRGR